jgi:hypothetical protein
MRWTCVLLGALLWIGSAAQAKPAFGTLVDDRCTALGWIPSRPYNPNGLTTTDPSLVNCALCHTNPPKSALNVDGKFWLDSGREDVSRFCQPPTQTNGAPVLAELSPQRATVGQLLELMVSATDPDNDALALSVSNAPVGATFQDLGNGTGTFRWTPSATQLGSRTVTFHATDAATPMASAMRDVTISVGPANRPPVLAAIGNRQVDVGATLSLTFSATDPDGDAIAYGVAPLPNGALLAGAQLTWTPTAADAGNHALTVTATDDGNPPASDAEAIVITVGNANRPPELAPIGARSVDLGTTGRIALVARDPDQNVLTLACSGLPGDATLTDLGDGTGEIVWTPSAVGSWSVTCAATDNGLPAESAQETFLLAARDPAAMANAPTLDAAVWRARGASGLLHVSGDAPEAAAARGDGRRVALFAMLADGTAAKLGEVRADAAGHFSATLPPFVAPCRVAAAANGQLGAPASVTDAPADCDAAALLRVKARNSCDGFSLRARGRRAPPDAVITASDPATAEVVFTLQTSRGGAFRARAATTHFVHALALRVEAGGAIWELPEQVSVKPCD